jgi:cellulose synthase/poly-beta-1,6-N-acetylglucosamine synthase-like glycosyltransferase
VAFAGEHVWSTLDLVSCVEPKISGDLMAIRAGIVDGIPAGLLNDDAYLEICCQRRGFHKAYCREAEVFIRIPERMSEYVSQRRRIYGGHRQLRRLFPDYRLSTTRLPLLLHSLFRQVTSVRAVIYSILLVCLDALVRMLARLDDLPLRYQGGRWPVIFTTKHKTPIQLA